MYTTLIFDLDDTLTDDFENCKFDNFGSPLINGADLYVNGVPIKE